MPVKEYVVCKDYELPVPRGWISNTVIFELKVELPVGTKIISAKIYGKAHCEAYTLIGLPTEGTTRLYFSELGDKEKLVLIFDYAYMGTCETREDTKDITPYFIPREDGVTGVNYIKLEGINHSITNESLYTWTVTVTVEYTGEPPVIPTPTPPPPIPPPPVPWWMEILDFLVKYGPAILVLVLVLAITRFIVELVRE